MNFLKIKPVIVPTNKDFNLNLNGFKEAINQNTILLVASAPTYPTGMIDPISELSNLALENKLLLHVDACIGGFLLSFLKKCKSGIQCRVFRIYIS